jgi:hypothetical protein
MGPVLDNCKTPIAMAKASQFIFDDCFYLFFQGLLLIFLSFGLLKLG